MHHKVIDTLPAGLARFDGAKFSIARMRKLIKGAAKNCHTIEIHNCPTHHRAMLAREGRKLTSTKLVIEYQGSES